ncbi:MAG: MBOAT family O-acyltransferase [Christensenellales bacterium]
MNFNSYSYLIFLPTVVIGYYLLPKKIRWVLLLLASYFFYACWDVRFAGLMLLSTTVEYTATRMMGRARKRITDPVKLKRALRGWLLFSLCGNLGLMLPFKYYGFVAGTLQGIFDAMEVALRLPDFSILLPVGISFFTFQAIGYTVDVYRGEMEPVKNFARYALFISFFPQLVAGPIERAINLQPQLKKTYDFSLDNMREGLAMILLGLCRKVLIADRLAVLVDAVYKYPDTFGGFSLVLATFFFGFQIYCDFCGYSDIAVGSAKLLGVQLMTNFTQPYYSLSITEFWRRWHLSLSTWFRDYVYFPMGGNRRGPARTAFNMMVVFLISGLWHGADWTFVVWGGVHGVYQLVGRWTLPLRQKLRAALRIREEGWLRKSAAWLFTMALVTLAWVFFRAQSLTEAFEIFAALPRGWTLKEFQFLLSRVDYRDLLLGAGGILLLFLWDGFNLKRPLMPKILEKPSWFRWGLALTVIFVLILFGQYGELTPFIYFQF